MIAPNKESSQSKTFDVRIMRQASPDDTGHWERFRVPYEPNLNVISVLQRIAALSKTASGKETTPVAWDCNCLEEVCGACTMVINGRVRQSCSALVDKLLEEQPGEIQLEPMSKFPVLRDLVVDRQRMFRALERVHAWVPVDDYLNRGPGPKESQDAQEGRYPLSECMTCGCCVEACPQYTKVELERLPGESDEAYQARLDQEHDKAFIGPQAISQAVLFNDHGTGKMSSDERMEALTDTGGIQACGNAQNCVAVCPKSIPLTTSIARAGRQATVYSIKHFFDR